MLQDKFDVRIESLRGISAFTVVLSHLCIPNWFDNQYDLSTLIGFQIPGHVFVLVFFVLSGYVIGVSYPLNSWAKFDSLLYLQRRFVRLYPIYLIAILVSLLTMQENWVTVLGNLFFMQNIVTDVLFTNSPLWTLNHEIVYYLLFVMVVRFKIPPFVAFFLALAASFSCLVFPAVSPLLPAYGTGFVFWCSGLLAAYYLPIADPKMEKKKSRFFLPMLLLIVICLNLNGLFRLVPALPFNIGWGLQNKVKIYDLCHLPIVFGTFLLYSKRYYHFLWPMIFSSFAIVLFTLGYQANSRGLSFFSTGIYWIALLSLLGCLFPIKSETICKLSFLGSISYAMYVVHTPLMHCFQLYFSVDTLPFFIVKTLLYLVVLFLFSFFLEKVVQPRVKMFLLGSNQKVK